MIKINNEAIISYLYCINNSVKLLMNVELDVVVPDVELELPLVEVVLLLKINLS